MIMTERIIIAGFIGLVGIIWLKYEYDLNSEDKSWWGFFKHLLTV